MDRRRFLKGAAALSAGLAAAGPLATQGMAATQKPAGLVPIGGIIAWLKSFTNIPALPDEYVELNGQVLNDAQSPLNGQTLPNLSGSGSGTKRFIRFSTTSGSTGGSETHSHSFPTPTMVMSAFVDYWGLEAGWTGVVDMSQPTEVASTLPSYYEAVPVMRIK